MKHDSIKRVKIQGKYRPSQRSYCVEKEVPWLTISGNWLAKLGFTIGSQVEIISMKNGLIIKKV